MEIFNMLSIAMRSFPTVGATKSMRRECRAAICMNMQSRAFKREPFTMQREAAVDATRITAMRYLIGTIRCWYGVPAHITYGAPVSGSALFGYWS